MTKPLETGGALRQPWRPAVLFGKFTSLANIAGTSAIFGLMCLICVDVIARNLDTISLFAKSLCFGCGDLVPILQGKPIAAAHELVSYAIVAAVYLQLSNTLHVGRFTRAEMLITSMESNRPIAAAIFNSFFSLLGVIAFAVIVYGTYFKFTEAWPDLVFGNAAAFEILVWPLRAMIFFGAALTAMVYLFQLSGSLADLGQAIARRRAATDSRPVGWGHLGILLGAFGLVAITAFSDLSRVQIGALSLIGIVIMICLGIHIAVGLIAIAFIAIWIMMGDPTLAVNAVKLASNEFLRNYFLGVVPLFVMMGLLVSESGIGKDTFDVARWIMRPIKGGMGVATVGANAIFAAITGSSIASAAVFTKVAAPHMMDNGYSARFAVGTVAGSSVLGMLIPPSLLLIIYAFVTEQSVGALFLAAIFPGIILAVAMGVMIIAMAHFWPQLVGNPTQDDKADENIASAAFKLTPILLLVALVMGGIYGGLFTAIEAGAVGAMGALIIALLKRRLTLRKLWSVLVETGHVTVAILFLILAANIYGRMLALSGLPQQMGGLISGMELGFIGFMALYLLVLVVLGMFLDSVSIMLIVLPLVSAIVVDRFGADLVWFGIVTVIVVEMGLLTPPLGICCYVVKSVLNDDRVSLKDIFIGSFPFVIIMLLVTILLIAFPGISLYLTR
ncbi:MAG TPA: TRAP transporter large permease [Alphaproteobacteria bacterium]|nr:TRAP transporter large permease [Alphaproteobacteria bacterium]